MKKIILSLSALALIVSCSENSISVDKSSSAIDFGKPFMGNSIISKADPVPIKDRVLYVTAFNGTTEVFTNIPLEKKTGALNWALETPKYWPIGGGTYTFWAATSTGGFGNSADGFKITGFDASLGDKDLMYSDAGAAATYTPPTSPDKVGLSLVRALSMLEFKAQVETNSFNALPTGYYVKVKIDGDIINTADCNNGIWSNFSPKDVTSIYAETKMSTPLVLTSLKTWTVIPQTSADNSTSVTITAQLYNDLDVAVGSPITKIINTVEWVRNKKYIYNITITPLKVIEFSDPTVVEWIDEEVPVTVP